jgi:hypothetical protein
MYNFKQLSHFSMYMQNVTNQLAAVWHSRHLAASTKALAAASAQSLPSLSLSSSLAPPSEDDTS